MNFVVVCVVKLGALGIQASGRDNMGKDESTSTYYSNRENRSLAQPQQRALSGWNQRKPGSEQEH